MRIKKALLLGAVCISVVIANVYAQTSKPAPAKSKPDLMRVSATYHGLEVSVTTATVLPGGEKKNSYTIHIGSPRGEMGAAGMETGSNDEGVQGKSGVFHRFFATKLDADHKTCYGYDITVESPVNSERPRFKVSFAPPSDAWKKNQEKRGECSNIVSLSGLPEPQFVVVEDEISLELLSNPQSGMKIYDFIRVAQAKSH